MISQSTSTPATSGFVLGRRASLSKLQLAVRSILTLISAFTMQVASFAHADEFDTMRERWVDRLTGGKIDLARPDLRGRVETAAERASQHWRSMNRQADRTGLWDELGDGKASNIPIERSYGRLSQMAIAYRTPGSKAADGTLLSGNPALRDDILGAMQWLYAHWYNEQTPEEGNWWEWELSIPMSLTDSIVLLDADLSASAKSDYIRAVLHFSHEPPRFKGANGTWQARIWILAGVILKNHAPDGSPRDWLGEVAPNLQHMCEYANRYEGFYPDGTFIQHETHHYTGGYGAAFIRDLSQILRLVADTPWNPPNSANVYRWVYDAYEPCIYEMRFFDSVRGREMNRKGAAVRNACTATQGILLLAETAPEPHRPAFRRMAKEWIMGNPDACYLATARSRTT